MAKILEIGNYPPPMCGWAIQTYLLEKELIRRDHTCRVLKINEGRQIKSSEYTDVQNGFDYFYKILRYAGQGFRFHSHVNGETWKGYLLALLAALVARLFRQPAVLTFHGGLPQSYFPRQDSWKMRTAFRLLFHLSGRLTCDSLEIKKAIEGYGVKPEKIAAIPCFSAELLDFVKVPLAPEMEEFLHSHHPVYFCYVSFRPEYRLPVLRQAMSRYVQEYAKAGFVWLGFPAKEMPGVSGYISQWTRQERNSLLLLGNLPHDEFLSLLTRCFAYVRTPACDGISASILESLALGIPVIASENGRRPLGVITYPENDADQLYDRLRYVAENYAEVKKGAKFENLTNNTKQTADWILEYSGGPTASQDLVRSSNGQPTTWQRLTQVGRDELWTRSQQAIRKRWDALASQIGVRPRTGRLCSAASSEPKQFFFNETDLPHLVSEVQRLFPEACESKIREAEQICHGKYNLLGYQRLSYGPKPDWHGEVVNEKLSPQRAWYKIHYLNFDEVGDSKIIWELNRHQHLVTLAMAYRLTRDAQFGREIFDHWFDWQRANPYPIGINWASSLEVAFRSMSWLWVWHLLSGTAVMPEGFRKHLCSALAVHGRHIEKYLSTYFSPNTHLLGEAVALFFIGTLCPEIPAAPLWRDKGWRMVCQQAERQVRSDGAYFEQSTYYHLYALDFFLHARILATRNEIPIPQEFDQVLQRMLDFLYGISQAGITPRLGDDDGGRVFDARRNQGEHLLDPLATGAVLFHRADWKAAAGKLREETVWLLGTRVIAEFDDLMNGELAARSMRFAESGVYVMSDGGRLGRQLVIDAGPQGTGNSGHGHADALSIHLSMGGQEWLTDPGTFSYVDGEETREAFRSTAAHNTMQVDGVSQATPTGPFSWKHLPEVRVDVWRVGETFTFFAGRHTGYGRLSEPVIHHRSVFYVKSRFWLIRDVADGAGEHQLDLFWHLAPRIQLNARVGSAFLLGTNHRSGLALVAAESQEWSQRVIPGWYSAAYGQKEPASVLHFSRNSPLPAGFTALLLPLEEQAMVGRLVEVTDTTNPNLYSCAYDEDREAHRWVFSEGGSRWQVGPLESDARVLYCRFDSKQQLLHFVVCDGTFFKMTGRSLFESCERTSVYEWQDESPASKVSERGKPVDLAADSASRLSKG
jgi:glycosyltransferase involved in cell wall biosynthesis